jgi:inorganic pyrophosphatase
MRDPRSGSAPGEIFATVISQRGAIVPAYDRLTGRLNVIIETSKGNSSKYKYDEQLGLFRLHKLLPAGAIFPFDFGFIPSTRGEDGDPLDVLVLAGEPTAIGSLVTVRLLGALRAEQTEGRRTLRNDRLIGVPHTDKIKPQARSFRDLSSQLLDQIEHFFISYNRYEGRAFRIMARDGPGAADRLVAEGIRRYRHDRAARKRRRGE